MASVFRQIPWAQQPQLPTRLADWLPFGTAAYIGSTRLVVKDPLFQLGTPVTITDTVYPGGRAIVGSASTSRLPVGSLRMADATTGLTLVAQFVNSTSSIRYVAGSVNTGGSYIEDFAVNMNAVEANSQDRLFINLRNTSGNQSYAGSTNTVLTQGKLHTAVWQWSGAGAFKLWVDGSEQAVSVTGSAFTGTTTGVMEFPLTLLNRNVRNAFSNGGAGLTLGLFVRIPSVAVSGIRLSSTPWQIFAPDEQSIWVGGPAPPGGSVFNPYFYQHIAGIGV